jgi:hypothetical protein
MSWIDITDTQLMFQLKNERAGFFSLIFRIVFQRLLNRNQCNYKELQCGFRWKPASCWWNPVCNPPKSSAKIAKMAHFELGFSSSGLMKSSIILRYWKIIIFELWFLNAWYEIWGFVIFGLFEDFLGFELMIFRSDDEVETV